MCSHQRADKMVKCPLSCRPNRSIGAVKGFTERLQIGKRFCLLCGYGWSDKFSDFRDLVFLYYPKYEVPELLSASVNHPDMPEVEREAWPDDED